MLSGQREAFLRDSKEKKQSRTVENINKIILVITEKNKVQKLWFLGIENNFNLILSTVGSQWTF